MAVALVATMLPQRALPGMFGAEAPIHLSVEIDWKSPPLPILPSGARPEPPTVELDLSAGRVLDAVAWPTETSASPEPLAFGGWRLGNGPNGQVRARIEAPISASLTVRAGGRMTSIPIESLLEAPQQSLAPSVMTIQVRRLPWDTLEVALADGGDGTVAPNSQVPVRVGLNVLAAEPGEALVHLTGALRPAEGGEVIQRWEASHVVLANSPRAPATLMNVPAPAVEGTYVLEVQASWQPVEDQEGTRIGRLIRRRRRSWNGPTTASRRVSFAVVAPDGGQSPEVRPSPGSPGTVVDSIDLARDWGHRLAASGRTPLIATGGDNWAVPEEAVVAPQFRDRLRGWFFRGAEAAVLGPADATGLSWSALGLSVPHPGQLHRLTLTVESGNPAELGVALVVAGAPPGRPRILLDSRANGPTAEEGAAPVTCSWPIWPDASDPVLVLVNRGTSGPIRIGSVALEELPAELPLPAWRRRKRTARARSASCCPARMPWTASAVPGTAGRLTLFPGRETWPVTWTTVGPPWRCCRTPWPTATAATPWKGKRPRTPSAQTR